MSITTPHRLEVLLGNWRRDGTGRERLAAALRSLILEGRIAVDSRLPAERTLATALDVSRATVTGAYDRLREQGYIDSRQGAGSWVTLPGGNRSAPSDAVVGGSGLEMRIAALPAPAMLEELFAAASRELPCWLDHHGYDPLGLPELRQAIAARFERRGLPTRPEQILVTNGALQALDLTIRATLPRGRRVLVELPSYPAALDALRGAGARLTPVMLTADGWDVGTIEAVARAERPTLAYLMPDFHNPIGAIMDGGTRRRVTHALERAGTLTVVDETFVELNLDEVAMPPPAASFAGGRTITIGSLSKSVWGGLRVGWVRADPALIHLLATARASIDLASPLFEQLVAARALDRLDEILAERRKLIQIRRAALGRVLDERLPTWRYQLPPGGLFIWTTLPAPISTSLSLAAARHDLLVTPGPRFAAAGLLERHLRLPFTLAPDQLERAVEILAALTPSEVTGRPRERLEYVA
ncbi:MAG: PLP-dependent aminotransferase family protein [Solirubrobacterales bacterium]|nr:PLP-dependent aminotransferase family protein [Solirubrobacterales bacterium]